MASLGANLCPSNPPPQKKNPFQNLWFVFSKFLHTLRSSGLYSFFRDCTFFKSLQLFEEGREIYEISRFKEKKFFSGRHKLWRPPVTFQWQLNTFSSVQNYLFSKFPFVFTNIFWVVATTCGDHWKFFFSLNDLFSKFSLLLQKLAGSWKMCSPGKLNIIRKTLH